MTPKVLVAYGTTNGSTAEIADAVARVLREEGCAAEALPAGAVTRVTDYDAVVVGGGLYAGRWHKDARRLLRRHRTGLAGRPLWLFSSGPLDPSATERDIPPVPGLRRATTGLDARGHATFGGCLREGAVGLVARMILRDGKGGDFRDFGRIEEWARRVAQDVTKG